MIAPVWCVLRSGGDYRPEHVLRLRDQVAEHLPGARFCCLTDLPGLSTLCETYPLTHNWPGWWSKMELFRPDLPGEMLYMDLDSAVVGDLGDMASIGRIAIMRDVYRPTGLQSSVMYLPERARSGIWRAFSSDARAWMQRYQRGGDQAFLERFWLDRVTLWQDALPGQVVSWKAQVRDHGLPEGARFIAFHGQPRPWDAGW